MWSVSWLDMASSFQLSVPVVGGGVDVECGMDYGLLVEEGLNDSRRKSKYYYLHNIIPNIRSC